MFMYLSPPGVYNLDPASAFTQVPLRRGFRSKRVHTSGRSELNICPHLYSSCVCTSSHVDLNLKLRIRPSAHFSRTVVVRSQKMYFIVRCEHGVCVCVCVCVCQRMRKHSVYYQILPLVTMAMAKGATFPGHTHTDTHVILSTFSHHWEPKSCQKHTEVKSAQFSSLLNKSKDPEAL